MSHHQNEIVAGAVASSKDVRTRRLMLFLAFVVVICLLLTGWTLYLVFQNKQDQAKAGQDLAAQVQAECNSQETISASLAKLCGLANQVSAKGDTGPAGPQGPPGPAGVDGVDGTNGVNGINGTPGKNGKNGTNGTDGADGKTGSTGAKGDPGPPGPKGDTGDTGPQGPKGDTGATGAAGEDAVPFTFSFTLTSPSGKTSTFNCRVTDPETTAQCDRSANP